jgi:hypothetical protein
MTRESYCEEERRSIDKQGWNGYIATKDPERIMVR